MGHYLSEMESDDEHRRRVEPFREWLRICNENDYIDVKFKSYYERDAENTLVQHTPCGLLVGNMITHLNFCPARSM